MDLPRNLPHFFPIVDLSRGQRSVPTLTGPVRYDGPQLLWPLFPSPFRLPQLTPYPRMHSSRSAAERRLKYPVFRIRSGHSLPRPRAPLLRQDCGRVFQASPDRNLRSSRCEASRPASCSPKASPAAHSHLKMCPRREYFYLLYSSYCPFFLYAYLPKRPDRRLSPAVK